MGGCGTRSGDLGENGIGPAYLGAFPAGDAPNLLFILPGQDLTNVWWSGTLLPSMLTIRLSRTGKSKQPYYRVVVQEKGRDPWAPALEVIGNMNPRAGRKDTVINTERAQYWLSKGAQPSDTVHNLFIELGLIKAEKVRNTRITAKRAKKIAEAAAKAAA